MGVLVEFRLRSDFTTRLPEFSNLAKDIAMHIAAEDPNSIETLLRQRFVKDATKSVRSLLATASDELGESISVVRFVRWDNEEPEVEGPEPPLGAAAALRKRA
jgi:elongation factor Ts